MIIGRPSLDLVTRFACVQFLALVAFLSLVSLSAFAADEDSTPDNLPEQPSARPVAEPAQAVDESTPDALPADVVQAQFDKFIKSVVDAAHSFAKTASADAADEPSTDPEAVAADPAATVVPAPAPAVDLVPVPVSDVKLTEAEIDGISGLIAEEKLRSAQRLAELDAQLSEAREQLATITATDGEGFIRAWLVLGPVPLDQKVANHDEESNKEILDRNFIPPEATPREGDDATIDDFDRTWTAVRPTDYFVDLAKVAADQERNAENAAYLGVAYITSEQEVANVKLAIGSDDGSVWRLNGKEVIRSYSGRGIARDQDTSEELTLKQGVNVLIFTVLNGHGPTAAAARFLDKDGNAVRGLKVSLTPPGSVVTQTENADE
jgi:hypothetical protein